MTFMNRAATARDRRGRAPPSRDQSRCARCQGRTPRGRQLLSRARLAREPTLLWRPGKVPTELSTFSRGQPAATARRTPLAPRASRLAPVVLEAALL